MRRPVTKKQIAVTVGLLTVLIAAGYWWSPHIWWAFQLSRSGAKVPSIAVTALGAPHEMQGWFTCRLGPLSFKLPPEIAEEAERSIARKNKSMISLKTPTVELLIHVPVRISEKTQPPLVHMAESLNVSPVQMLVDGYRATTDDFRWTMSRAELQRHQMLLNLGYLFPQYQHHRGTKVESRFDGLLEGLLMIHDRTQATFEWRAKSGATAGVLGFTATDGDLNLDQVRDICASVTCDEASLGPALAPADLAALVDSIEMKKD